MLKLKHLFSNIDLATMIVENWEYDDLEPLQYWRISSNAIYPFKHKDEVLFLRLAPIDEKIKENIEAELDFLLYLQSQNYSAILPQPSRKGALLEEVDTPWGKYYACCFKRVRGLSLSRVEITTEIANLWGKSLGSLHKLSSCYIPTGSKRLSWQEHLEWIRDVLIESTVEAHEGIREKALEEVNLLEEYFKTLPITTENYGLIHYDFELDNVFYDEETGEITPIDFDDSMYHWYGMDIEQTLDSIRDELEGEKAEKVIQHFLQGYKTQYPLQQETIEQLPIFSRFAKLYGYARVLRSTKEKWENEPQWMLDLRKKLDSKLIERSQKFGNPL